MSFCCSCPAHLFMFPLIWDMEEMGSEPASSSWFQETNLENVQHSRRLGWNLVDINGHNNLHQQDKKNFHGETQLIFQCGGSILQRLGKKVIKNEVKAWILNYHVQRVTFQSTHPYFRGGMILIIIYVEIKSYLRLFLNLLMLDWLLNSVSSAFYRFSPLLK